MVKRVVGRWLLRRLVREALSGERDCPTCGGSGHPYDSRGERFDYDRKCKRCGGKGKLPSVAPADREADVEAEAASYGTHPMTSAADPMMERRRRHA